ncbi:DEAD/DEAH box helicase family protein [Sporosarcina sp. BP05]|uniref:restriction endonuclease n=1 Tax=Sporosarcina sp. BP05 TaxID=2758726 RepID=UPI001649541A|nr:DEAD/DEAH box helicase family protein [Sporosarcina sp. BP05]
MKIQFQELQYQEDAIESITRVFVGQQIRQSNFTISDNDRQGKLFGEHGLANNVIYQPAKMLQNVQQIQIDNGIPISENLTTPFPQFNIDMETGTGKTFVYLKSILKLNEQYGFTKFVIVVPSVAIREGVMKTYQMTKDVFKPTLKEKSYHVFPYNSAKLDEVRNFAQNDGIEVMVINIQAFSKRQDNKGQMNIIFRDDIDAMYGVAPITLISETNPVVIIDEPQSVDNTENAQKAIESLSPSVTFRYSATHRNKSYPLLYKLGPVEAYQQKLVKQIEVAGIKSDSSGNDAYMRLINVKTLKSGITATVEMYVKSKNDITKKEVKLEKGDDVYLKSKRIAAYEKMEFVQNLSAEPGNEYIEFSGETPIIRLSEMYEIDRQVKRGQIRKTIEEHLDRELKLNPQGIKVLSLFFIDNVANYRGYDDEGKALPGEYATVFEEEYNDLMTREKYKKLQDYSIPVEEVHDGYFAADKSGKKFKNTLGSGADDETAYQIIMKDKEDLLTFYDEKNGKTKKANKLRFIFSHSTLKEGWDNPNVFQICTLIESKDTITKRQKIGRGLRIAVNQQGERIQGFDVNTLTVMANESYDEFARDLQKEYEEDGMKFGIFEDDIFSTIMIKFNEETGLKEVLGKAKSKELVQFFKDKEYLDKKNKGTENLARALKDRTLEVPEEIAAISKTMVEQITSIILEEFDRKKIDIKDRAKRVEIKVQKEALAEPFIALWDRIKYQTTYSLEFDTEQFIDQAAEMLAEELEVRIEKLEYVKANLESKASGIEAVNERFAAFGVSESQYVEAPDILSFLQNETNLTRTTLIETLKKSDTLRDFKRNPQMYMMEVARIINIAKRHMMVDGIKYERLEGDVTYDQQLFLEEELTSYEDKVVETNSQRTPYNHIIYDSNVERDFAIQCEKDEDVKFYIKLPAWFKVKTPLGPYNPDWALLKEEDGKEKLYFVIETKGDISSDELRPSETAKIRCGKKHFKALDTGIKFKKVSSYQNV